MQTQIQESTLYPDIIQYFKTQGFDTIGETKLKATNTRPDIIFEYAGHRFVVEVKLDDKKVALEATAQAARYAGLLKTDNFIVLVYPKSIKQNTLFGDKDLTHLVLHTPLLPDILGKNNHHKACNL